MSMQVGSGGGTQGISGQQQGQEQKLDAFEKKYGFQNMTQGRPVFTGKEGPANALNYSNMVKGMSKEEKIAHKQEIKELFGSTPTPKPTLQVGGGKSFSDKAFGALNVLGKIAVGVGFAGGGTALGAGIGALVGAVIGAPFAGIGAAPGAVAGAVIGGFLGLMAGSLLGAGINHGYIPLPKLGAMLPGLSFIGIGV